MRRLNRKEFLTALGSVLGGTAYSGLAAHSQTTAEQEFLAGDVPENVKTGVNESLPVTFVEAYTDSPTSYDEEWIEENIAGTLEELSELDVEVDYFRTEIDSEDDYRKYFLDLQLDRDKERLPEASKFLTDNVNPELEKRLKPEGINVLLGDFEVADGLEYRTYGQAYVDSHWSYMKRKNNPYFVHNYGAHESAHHLGIRHTAFPDFKTGAILPDLMTKSPLTDLSGWMIDQKNGFGPSSIAQWSDIKEEVLES